MVELNRPIEEIIKKTLAVMTTVGEWKLMDITAHKETRPGLQFDRLIFHVCLLFICKGIIQYFFMITKGKKRYFFLVDRVD
jgi:hypothetical protein